MGIRLLENHSFAGKKYLGFVFVGRYFIVTRPVSIFKIIIVTIVSGKDR